jgi:DNA polymerase-3 subunit gamma/tau
VSYTVLARRYRPTDFDGVVGQESIARTLRNAIEGDRTAHAYLFCGTRGVGKTSMARIFARAMNASPELGQADEIAEAILRGDDLDVIEIDGASNRGINEARDLIAGAGLSPARCPYRIYIIDEVHMLTREAFNALLKTMEEPPSHVKFILCTTEPQRVPATIQSRCQRFDFRPIRTAEIASKLTSILESEGITAAPAALQQLARLGRGSMRDALSMLDRVLAAGEASLDLELVQSMLGMPDHAVVTSLVDAIIAGDPSTALEEGARLLDQGLSVETALELLVDHLRTMLIITTCGAESELIDIGIEEREKAVAQAEHFDAAGLVHLMALGETVARNARMSSVARALFDAVLVRMTIAEHLAELGPILEGSKATVERKKKATRPAKQPTAPSSPEPRDVESSPAAPAPESCQEGAALWAKVLQQASQSPSDQARLDDLEPGSFDGVTLKLTVVPEGGAVVRWLETQRDWLADFVHRATDRRVRIELDTSAVNPQSAPSVGEKSNAQVRDLPAVKQAEELFDAVVINVEDEEQE